MLPKPKVTANQFHVMPNLHGPSFQPFYSGQVTNMNVPRNSFQYLKHGESTIPQLSTHPRYFGGGSLFQAMAGNASTSHGIP